jgi:maltose/moltooligosaccharide transporter
MELNTSNIENAVTCLKSTTPKTYKVGTLVYTKYNLFTVMFWMLGGNLCFQIMEALPPQILPLQLKHYGASDKLIGLLSASLPAIIAVFLNPIIGVQSDRHRSSLGRRRPFLLWCTGPVMLCLFFLAFSDSIGAFLWPYLNPLVGSLSKEMFSVMLIGVFIFIFYIFNTYILSAYQFLFADVIPQEVMGKFIGMYRAIGAMALFFFSRYILGYADRYIWVIYTGTALFYGLSFILLVWQVKEGEYPPIDDSSKHDSFITSLKKYIKECFAIPFYLKLYSIVLFFWAGFIPFMTFIVFYATGTKSGYATSLGMTLDAFGKVRGWTFMLQIPLFFAAGYFIDRFHPLRVIIVGIAGCALTYFFSFFLVYNSTTLLIWLLLNSIFAAAFAAAYLSMFPCLLPKDKYGQYFAANNLFGFAGLIFAPVLCGWFLDLIKNYRFLFLWSGFFTILSLLSAISVYRHWQRLGGEDDYVPPVA